MSYGRNAGINVFAGEPPDPTAGTGRVWWVGATATVPGGVAGTNNVGQFGSTPQMPFATIDYAIGQCVANRGDVIYVLPQHEENITSATDLVVDVAGVSIIGLGRGTDRPQLNFTATAGSIEMDAANTRLSNFHLIADITAVVVGINVDADYVELDHLHMDVNEGTVDDFITYIDVDTVSDTYIHDCKFQAENATAGCNEVIRLDTADRAVIVDNHFDGDFAQAAIIGEGAANTNDGGILIARNYIYNSDAGAATSGIDLNVAFVGVIAHNMIGNLANGTDSQLLLDPGSCLSFENYVNNTINEAGVLAPATVSS